MKSDFFIKKIPKDDARGILLEFHYLKDLSKGFKSGINYGLYTSDGIVGVIIYTGFPVPELVQGLFGLSRDDQDGFFELSRLCIVPSIQASEHNIASWFVSKTIKLLRKETKVRAILSYADADYHDGTVYRACNFGYYGLSDSKKDFWIKQPDGTFVKHSRGAIKNLDGEWRNRSQKHRYLLVYDKTLTVLWRKQ